MSHPNGRDRSEDGPLVVSRPLCTSTVWDVSGDRFTRRDGPFDPVSQDGSTFVRLPTLVQPGEAVPGEVVPGEVVPDTPGSTVDRSDSGVWRPDRFSEGGRTPSFLPTPTIVRYRVPLPTSLEKGRFTKFIVPVGSDVQCLLGTLRSGRCHLPTPANEVSYGPEVISSNSERNPTRLWG